MKKGITLIAVLAAVLAVTSGAFAAANHYLITSSSQIKDGAVSAADLSPAARKALQGQQGAVGSAGPQGLAGAQGPKGDNGATGAQGSKGDNGATGAQGSKGDTGAGARATRATRAIPASAPTSRVWSPRPTARASCRPKGDKGIGAAALDNGTIGFAPAADAPLGSTVLDSRDAGGPVVV